MGYCSNVNCHFQKQTTNWGDPAYTAPADCGSCHGNPPSATVTPFTGGAAGSHVEHDAYYSGATNCVKCHSNNTTFAHATSAGNRALIIALKDKNNLAGGTYSQTNITNYLPSYAPKAFGTCSAIYCHSDGLNNATFTPKAVPTWGNNTLTCASCHGGDAASTSPMATVAHNRHITAGTTARYGANITCDACHNLSTSNGTTISAAGLTTNHVNRLVEVNMAVGTYSNASHVPGPVAGTCNSTYCHSNGKGAAVAQAWNATTLNCTSCHPSLGGAHARHMGSLTLSSISFYGYTANKSAGSDPTTTATWASYGFGCANCHPYNKTSHMNGTIEVIVTKDAAGGSIRNLNAATAQVIGTVGSNSVTCANIYCHSDGKGNYIPTSAWSSTYGADRCSKCHGNAPAGSHQAHAVGIHNDDVSNLVVGKLAASGAVGVSAGHGDSSQSTTIGCNICHVATTNYARNKYNSACTSCHTGGADATEAGRITALNMHVNGTVDLSFYATTNIKTKAQLRPTSFADYTAAGGYWTRTTYKTNATSVDTAKLALNNTMYSGGNCSNIACHNGKAVNWTTDAGKGCIICHTRL
jgi:predicted CxxxxCH...CXXCH cytochrome family protein